MPMSDFEVNQALQLATTLLAQQGILDPTAAELRTALFGGPLLTADGRSVPLQGVLQGRAVNTSTSPYFGTSDTPPRAATPAPPAAAGANAAPKTAASAPSAAAGANAAPRAGAQTRR
jgi:hypothetical protein